MRKSIIKLITAIMAILLLFGFSVIDTESIIPYLVIAVSGFWMILFFKANRVFR